MALAPLCLERLGGGYAGASSAPCSAHVPLDVVTAIWKSVPVVVAFGISGNGKHLPLPIRLDAFDNIDPGHLISPAIRLKRTAGKTAYGRKLQKRKGVPRSWHSTTELLPLGNFISSIAE